MDLENYSLKVAQYCPTMDLQKIIKAYNFADSAHMTQYRKSGEKYVIHPIEVSLILAELEMDEETIIAALLHDVVEDTEISLETIEKEFGKEVALLVDGVTKLGHIKYETKEERQAENLRKMFLAMAKDIRVVLIKLADRLHNMRTLKYMSDEKKKEKARETLEIYAPIAHRLGISKIKWELEDLSLLYLEEEKYFDLVTRVNKKREERESVINQVINEIKRSVELFNISCDIYGRPKNFYSIYKKMTEQQKNFEEIYDLTAIRIIVDNVNDCYGVLGVVHSIWKPIPGRFKDYIAMPKANMYQSLHTTVIGNSGEPFEIQIRTWEMHRIAEYGIAAHWKYKEGAKQNEEGMEDKLTWLRQMMEWQRELENPQEFMDSLKLDLFNNQVYVFTPKGEVHELPDGSTPVDFAYKIHSAVGNKCVGAKVNGRIVPLNYQLASGQIVEIITSNNNQGPSRDWLKFVKSTQARNKIRHWFKKERKEENIEKGKEMLEREIRRQGYQVKQLMRQEWYEPVMERLSCQSLEDLYATVGYGGIMTAQVVPKLKELYRQEQKEKIAQQQLQNITQGAHIHKDHEDKRKSKDTSTGIVVKGIDDVLIRFARCCSPVPGDDIIGYVTRGRGVTIHRADCNNFEKTDDANNRFIEVDWSNKTLETAYTSEIQIIAPDRKGLLSEITLLISSINLVVTGVNAKISKNGVAVINLTLEITDADQLSKLMTKLQGMPGIIEVKRATS